uniref:Uncharacterized protein n=1 Tax=Nelumbo nucifera TaxID=4432 RepID=A0A822ZP60_NELNU|nr:TPA_asm: hypothetical protein HUJ06_017701 [Nelumbo nucifera]
MWLQFEEKGNSIKNRNIMSSNQQSLCCCLALSFVLRASSRQESHGCLGLAAYIPPSFLIPLTSNINLQNPTQKNMIQ